MRQKKLPALALVLQRLVLLRLFLPLMALSVIAISGVGYLGEQTFESQQHQKVKSMARIVDRYLDQAARTLDAVARVAEVNPSEKLTFMQGTWEAYGYFDTLYYLDASSRITLLAPPNPRYLGLDMSNLPYFQSTGEKKSLIISRPFISLRTGNPTVYLVRQLDQGGQMVGELNLRSLQDEITYGIGMPSQDMIFIMDQSGMLLAHPSSDLVKQQTNQSYLEIFRRGLDGDATLVYEYAGTMVLGSATRVERSGWVVVDQVPLLVSLGPFAWAFGLTLLASLVIWLVLAWSLRHQLEQHVAIPLARLSQGTGALANGDFSQGKALVSIPAAFAELTALATDFQQMSDALEARQVALQESEERYRSLFDGVPIGLYRTTPAGQILDINPAFVHMLGYPDREALLALNAVDPYADPEDRNRWRTLIEREGTVRDFQTQFRRWDGTILWVRNSGRIVQDGQGQVLYYEGSLEDITERKRVEEEMINAHKRFERLLMFNEALLSAIPTPVFYKDKEARYLGCNRAFSEFTGVSSDQIRGKTVMELWPSENAEVYHRKDLELMHNPEQQIYEFRVRDKDGVDRPVIFAKSVFRDERKQVAGIVGAFLDITGRKRAEEEIHQLNQELEQRVIDRTAQLEAANKELEAFAYSVSHDLRAPLRHIDGFLELLRESLAENLDEHSQHYMETIVKAAKHMGQLIDDLLSFSRMGRQEMSKTQVDLAALVRDVIEELAPAAQERNIHWNVADLPTVSGDRAMLRLVWTNLLSNALKFTRLRQEAEIEIGCKLDSGAEVEIFVRDNGVGFDMTYTDKLFGVFQRLHSADEFEGTGIGLANVRRIIDRHGGRTWAEGKVGGGATFYFSLPPSIQGAADGAGSVGGVPPSPFRHTPQMKPSGFTGDKADG